MLETNFFTDRINFICELTLSELSKDFIFQAELVDSNNFNHTFNAIENHLTSLYEKTRALQDVIAYLEEYIKTNVIEYSSACETILSQIETDRDKLKQKTYMTLSVSFNANTNNKKDRNGKILSECSVKNKMIMNYLKNPQVFTFSSVNKEKGFKCYNENLKNLLSNEPYRTFYILDAPVIDGLMEQIRLSFDKTKLVNMITINPVKCKVTDIEYIYQNKIEHEDGFLNLAKRTKTMDAINITLKSDQYKEKVYLIDNLRKASNCWEKIAESEYLSTINSSALNQSEIDSLLGITQFRQDYSNYLREIELWKQKRAQVAELNRQNGYDDKVPDIDIIAPPSELGLNTQLITKDNTVALANTCISSNNTQINTVLTSHTEEDNSLYTSIKQLNEILPSSERYRYQSITEAMANTNYGFIKNVSKDNSFQVDVSTINQTSNYNSINKYREGN